MGYDKIINYLEYQLWFEKVAWEILDLEKL